MLAKRKLNSIERKISEPLINSKLLFKVQKNTESIDPKVSATSNGKTMILSTCAVCGSKKLKFIKKQEAKELLNNLGIRTPLSKTPLLGDVLF